MLSVIIPTRNRGPVLQRALASLLSQTLTPARFEVLVIDNGSSDETRLVAAAACRQADNVGYFLEERPGLHAGRHRGLKEARGDILVFADDDIRATPDWLSAISENFCDPNVALVGGNNYPDFMASPPRWLEQLWREPRYGGQAIPALSVLSLPPGRRDFDPYLVWGCNFSIRRQVLLDAGGFHPDAMPQSLIRFRGDGETHVSAFVATLGLRCLFDSRASIYHAVPSERMSLEYFRQRAYNQGVSDSYTWLRNGSPSLVTGLIRALRRFVSGFAASLEFLKPGDVEVRKLQHAVRQGYREGYAYHQAIYHRDPEVRAWVHQANYF